MEGLGRGLFLGDGDQVWVGPRCEVTTVAQRGKTKKAYMGENNGSGITQGRTDEIISGDGNAENASPKKKKEVFQE